MEKYYFKDGDICKKKGYLVASLDCSKCNAMQSYSLDEKYIKCTLLEVIRSPELAKDLTKREHFAFEFCKKFLENDLMMEREGRANAIPNTNDPCVDNATWAVRQADELIKALNKEKEDAR